MQTTAAPTKNRNGSLDVCEEVITLQGWPTDVVSVNFAADDDPHTVLVFVPGNRK